MVAAGGNPGLAAGTNNTSVSLVAALGPCGSLTASTFINVDEVTTVAAAYALAPFSTSSSALGSSSVDQAALASAFTLASYFADTSRGTSPGPNAPVGTTVPSVEINTLADILASCVNSIGGVAGDGSACGNLFSLTTASGSTAATDTFGAALHLAASPSLNLSSLINLITPAAPFQPILPTAPASFAVGMNINSGLAPSASALLFGSSSIGSAASTQTLTLSNTTSAPISISGISISGLASADFSEQDNCVGTLAPSATCTLTAKFAPSAIGPRVAVLAVANNSNNATLQIDLTGFGTYQTVPPVITAISPASIVTGSPATTITITGTGFTPSSSVYFYNTFATTTFISSTSLSITAPASYLGSVVTIAVIVRNPGWVSNTVYEQVVNPAPTLTSISPSTVVAGAPQFALTLTGTGLSYSTTATINGHPYTLNSVTSTTATIYVNPADVASVGNVPVTLANPSPGGGTSQSQQLSVIGAPNRLRTLNFPTNDIAYDSVHNLIYASVSSTSTTSPNSVVSIDPIQGVVVTTQSTPGQPTLLAASSDGSYLYVSIPSTGKISRLLLPGLTPDISWSLGTDQSGNPNYARDMQTAPGLPHTVAVSSAYPGTSAYGVTSLFIFDDGVARSAVPSGSYSQASYDTITWGANASTIYGTMAQFSGGPEYIFTVSPSGAVVTKAVQAALSGFVDRLTYNNATNILYSDHGDVVSPSTGTSVGNFGVAGPLAVDTADNKAFFLEGADIQAFDLTRYSSVNAIKVPNLSGSRIVQWGASGLAVGGGNQVFLVDGTFVSPTGVTSPVGGYVAPSPTLTAVSPATVSVGATSATLTLTGANFTQAAVVTWNGQTIPSIWQSATQVTATIPASMLAQPLAAPVLISNGPGTENSGGVNFTVLPDASPNTQIATVDIPGQDMVWDPTRGLLYVAVTDPSVPNGNSIVTINPATAAIQKSVYVGNQPSTLGISDDGTYLYAGFQTSPTVERFALADFSLNLTIPLTLGGVSESFAGDIKVAPRQNQTIAVSMGNHLIEPRDAGGLAIFDNAVQRTAVSHRDMYKLAWGKDATTLIGNSDPVFQPQGISVVAIDSTGVASVLGGISGLTDLGLRPHYDAGTNLVYTDGGDVANSQNGSTSGLLEFGSVVVPDSTLNRAYVLRQVTTSSPYVTGVTYSLDIYNLQLQTYLKSITLPGVTGYASQMVRWGTEGIAILTESSGSEVGELYILQGSDISGLATPPPGSISLSPSAILLSTPPATVTVTGTGFVTASMVLVDGTARATTYVSPTQLTFQLTSADQAFANYLDVVVANPGGSASPATTLPVNNPAPAMTSLNPSVLPLNSSNLSLTITGAGFLPASVVSFNGSVRTTAYVSATQLSATLNTFDVASLGSFPIAVTNPGPGGGTSAAAALTINNPVPVVNPINPSVVGVGSPGQIVYLFGSGFLSTTVVQVNGASRPTTYVSTTEVTVQLTTSDFATAGNLSFVALNPAPGGGPSTPAILSVKSGLPGQITLAPSVVLQGNTSPTLITVTGSNFVPGTQVSVNNTNRAVTLLSSTQLTFLLTIADQAVATSTYVFVTTPQPQGGTSIAQLTIAASAGTPIITSISPTQFTTNSGATYFFVYGSGFTASSVIEWNGTPVSQTYYGNSGYLEGFATANLLSTSGTASIAVNTPTASPSLSNAIAVSIVNPAAPTVTSISPSNGPTNTPFTATINGTNFTTTSTVSVNGIAVPTSFSSSTQVTAAVPASAVLPGNLLFSVTTPAPGGGTSGSVAYTAYIPVANNAMVYNSTNGLFYLSVPGSSGAPYGNSIVSLDPATGALGTPIFVGSEPDQMSLASDGNSMWVSLDGASAVRQVNLLSGTAGLQFPLPALNSTIPGVAKVTALATLPGSPNSVVVSEANQIGIFDNGTLRGSLLNGGAYSLQVNTATSEVYGGTGNGYYIWAYSSSGMTTKSSFSPGATVAQQPDDRLQFANGVMYDDYRSALGVETGALVGQLGASTTSTSPTAIDASLGLAFVLDTPVTYSQLPTQIQAYSLSNFTASGTAVIPVSVQTTNNYSPVAIPTSMFRWGANGLAFRNSVSVYSLRSNLVKDLSTQPADLSVSLAASGPNATGTQSTFVATISNAGSATATEVVVTAVPPTTGTLVSAVPSTGTCTTGSTFTCDLGSLPSNGTATVTYVVNQQTPGTSVMSLQVSGSQPDSNLTNNQVSSTATITGATYSAAPTLTSIAPSTIVAGSAATAITITGTGFGPGSSVLLDGVTLPTNVASSTQLIGTIPTGGLATMGWHAVTVSNPAPGGGISSTLPLTVYSSIPAGASHILYDPFSRRIFATLNSSTPTGNSVEALDPNTGTFTAPVSIGSEPTRMALSDDGQMMYVLLTGSNQIMQYNMLTQQPQFGFAVTPPYASTLGTSVSFAVQTGSETTLAITQSANPELEIVDFNAATSTASARPATAVANFVYPSYSPHFVNPSTLVVSSNSTLQTFSVTSSGVAPDGTANTSAYNAQLGPFQLVNGRAYSSDGAILDATTVPATLLGSQPGNFNNTEASVAADPALGREFLLASPNGSTYSSAAPTGIAVFDTNAFASTGFLPLTIVPNASYPSTTALDVLRWGQDGLAALTSDGTIYLLRGPAIVPQLLQTNTAPMLASNPLQSLQHGSGNTVLTLSGSNFVPGIAVTWNGGYRTTTLVSATQVTVDVPASDLISAGTANVIATNPGSQPSSAILIPIN